MAANNGEVWVGPWGEKDGNPFDFRIKDGERIAGFHICANSKCVYYLSLINCSGDVVELSGDNCDKDCDKEVIFDKDEYITGFSGTYGSTYVTSLSFITNKRTCGPYGEECGTAFLLPVLKGKGKFVGIFGWKKPDGFSGLGAILKPE